MNSNLGLYFTKYEIIVFKFSVLTTDFYTTRSSNESHSFYKELS
jgi:hypothetical protein